MKKQTQTKSVRVAWGSTRQKVWGIIALAGLFTCGFMVGYAVRRPIANVATPATTDLKPTCTVIQELILNRIFPESSPNAVEHLYNADTYSILVERGCPENAEHYKNMALREIEIATALQNETDLSDGFQTEIVIDTYKKMDMQREAQQFLDKVQKLTNPAIDFILQMQQIINEQ